MGLSAAFASLTCFKLVAVYFPNNRFALMSGLSMTAAMLGAVCGEAPLSYLVHQYHWRSALSMIALFGLILAAMSYFILDKSYSLGDKSQSGVKNFHLFKNIIGKKQTWWLSLYSGLAFAPFSVFGGLWGVPFLEQAYQLDPIQAAGSISYIFIGFAIGCPFSGWLSDRMQQRKPVMAVGTLLSLISLYSIVYLSLPNFLVKYLLFIFGFSTSCFFLCFSMIKEQNEVLFAGTALGFMNSFDSLCEAVSEPLIGKLFDLSWKGKMISGIRFFSIEDYRFGFLALIGYLCGSLLLLLFIKETYCRTEH